MNNKWLASLGATALALGISAALLAPQPIAGQAGTVAQKAAAAAAANAATKPWTGKTPEGVPDLQGYWTNNSYTPLQRPANLGDKATLTPDELVEANKRRAEAEAGRAENNAPGTTADVHYDFTQFGLDRSQTRLANDSRTGMITDPPNGQLPPTVAADAGAAGGRGGARGAGGGAPAAGAGGRGAAGGGRGAGAAAAPAAGARGAGGGGGANYNSVNDIPIGSRCIWTNTAGPIMMPPGYNPAYQIIQGPGVVMILIENQHEVRVIPTDNRPHAPSAVKPYLGDSTGHWEGNTLVVETTNYNPRVLTGTFQGTGPDLKVIEKFTRLTGDQIKYEFTVSDPKKWTAPWTGNMPFVKINGPIFEHACTEGNFGIYNTLNAMRLEEKKAAEAAAAKQQK